MNSTLDELPCGVNGVEGPGDRPVVPGRLTVAVSRDPTARRPEAPCTAAGRIGGVPAPVVITDPADPRVADFRDLKAGDRPEGTPRGADR